jgi:hypothetical protein
MKSPTDSGFMPLSAVLLYMRSLQSLEGAPTYNVCPGSPTVLHRVALYAFDGSQAEMNKSASLTTKVVWTSMRATESS